VSLYLTSYITHLIHNRCDVRITTNTLEVHFQFKIRQPTCQTKRAKLFYYNASFFSTPKRPSRLFIIYTWKI